MTIAESNDTESAIKKKVNDIFKKVSKNKRISFQNGQEETTVTSWEEG